jgi:lysozyme
MLKLKSILLEVAASSVIDNDFISYIQSVEGKQVNSKGLHYAYKDDVGVLTIGYGHTGNVTPGQTITDSEAINLLKQDLEKALQAAKTVVANDSRFTDAEKDTLTPLEWKMFTDYSFNLGQGGFEKFKTFRKAIVTKDINLAEKEYERKAIVGGKFLPIGRNKIFKERLLDRWANQIAKDKESGLKNNNIKSTANKTKTLNRWFDI